MTGTVTLGTGAFCLPGLPPAPANGIGMLYCCGVSVGVCDFDMYPGTIVRLHWISAVRVAAAISTASAAMRLVVSALRLIPTLTHSAWVHLLIQRLKITVTTSPPIATAPRTETNIMNNRRYVSGLTMLWRTLIYYHGG